MRRKPWLLRPVFLVVLLFCLGVTAVTFFLNPVVFYVEFSVLLLILAYVFWQSRATARNLQRLLTRMAESLSPSNQTALTQFPLPVLLTSGEGEILWHNERVEKMMTADRHPWIGRQISELFSRANWWEACQPAGMDIICPNKRRFTVFGLRGNEGGTYTFYCVENTELKTKAEEYDLTRPSVLVIAIDNYDDLMQSYRESEKAHLLVQIDRILEEFIGQTNGFLRKTERDKYIAVIEERHMRKIMEGKFSVLDRIRSIVETGKVPATISIGVGRSGTTFADNEKQACQALDMCLGRGGDQAAVKTGGDFQFFGGVSRGIEKKTKVKTRIASAALHDLILASDNVIIMGHRFGDLDSAGSSVGLVRCCRELGKPAIIATDLTKNLAIPLIQRLTDHGFGGYFEHPDQLLAGITRKTLLIVVDTHIAKMLESEELYRRCPTVAVIDHHRKMVGHIDNAVIFYHEPYASSASEMVAELVQYLSEQTLLGRYEAEALLAGIMLDTKNFVLKTGVRTFEAAAYLRRLGADTVEVKKLFANSMDSYQKRAQLVASAQIHHRCAVAASPYLGDDTRLIAPQAADEMLGIVDVDASFVLYETPEGGVSISARSMGAFNVQVIMEQLGGGGHLTMAGAQLRDIPLEDAKKKLVQALEAYQQARAKALPEAPGQQP